MGVYIKGMEMPTDCIFCPMFPGAWTMCTVLNKTTRVRGRPDDCPLAPVPPHGRLGDLDELDKKHEKLSRDFCHGYFKSTWDFVCAARKIFYDAPTIIEAEETLKEATNDQNNS